jgi:hypothetical protein
VFSSQSNLNTHKRKNLKCGKLQKEKNLPCCEYCGVNYTVMNKHVCKNMNVIKKMKEELEEKENQIRFLDTKTLLLEQELNIFKKMFEEKDSLVTKIALQPKTNTTTSTTTTMYNNLSVFDVEEITRRLNERMETVEYTDLLESGLLCEK